MTKQDFKKILKDTFPVMTGYVVLAVGFSVIMRVNGFPAYFPILMSLIIYAGSMQYAAIGLFTGGASYITVALTTLAVNARHFFYGISMLNKYKGKAYEIFALTDETYSLVCKKGTTEEYCFWVSVIDHLYWVLGTVLGTILGGKVSFDTTGIDFALTALFITVFTDQWLTNKDHRPALTGLGLSAFSLLVFGKDRFLIPAMFLIFLTLMIPYWKEEKKKNE